MLGQRIERIETVNFSVNGDSIVQRAAPFNIHLNDSNTGNVGRVLTDIDRELRRSTAFLIDRSQRPTKSVGAVELLEANHTHSIDIVVAASREIYRVMTSQPLSFAVTLSWFWEHRFTRTRVQSIQKGAVEFAGLDELIVSGGAAVRADELTSIHLTIDIGGVSRFWFSNELPGFGDA